MKLRDALRIGGDLLAKFAVLGVLPQPVPVNWSWKVGKKRLRLKGEASVEEE